MRKTLCVDFDGVLHAYTSGWKGVAIVPDGPVEGAVEWLVHAVERYDVCIYSSRSKDPTGLEAMQRALRRWLERAGQNAEHVMSQLQFPVVKPAAWLTIDDRCICFEGRFPTDQEIDDFQPWYRRGT